MGFESRRRPGTRPTQAGVLALRCAARWWPAAFPPGFSCTPIACSEPAVKPVGVSWLEAPAVALLSLNGPLSSGNAGTRAFLSHNIRGRQVPQEPLALWVGPSSEEGLHCLPGKPQCLWLGRPVRSGQTAGALQGPSGPAGCLRMRQPLPWTLIFSTFLISVSSFGQAGTFAVQRFPAHIST